jgi:hypothetical protein
MTLNSHTVGKYAAPLAPAIYYGWTIYTASMAADILQPLAIVGALTAVVALEAVGMGAGDNAMRFTVKGHWLAIPSWLALMAYTAVGMYELWGGAFQFIFLFAFLAYVGAGMYAVDQRNTAAKTAGHEERKAVQLLALQAEERAKEQAAANELQLSLAKIDAQKAVALAKVTANDGAKITPKIAKITPEKTAEPRKKRSLTLAEKQAIGTMETGDIVATFGVEPRLAQLWRKEFAPPVTAADNRMSGD